MNKQRIRQVIAVVLAATFLAFLGVRSCQPGKQPPSRREKTLAPDTIRVPEFSADSAFDWVSRQVAFGPRVPNSSAHRKCGDWLVASLQKRGASVKEQTGQVKAWDGTTLQMRNIIAEFNPEARKRVLLAAHWDTRPYADKDSVESMRRKPIDGANDGASGVAVLLELARLIQMKSPSVGVDIILFDAEDYGAPEWKEESSEDDYLTWCLGSQYWEKNPHRPNYQAQFGILLDMVGGRNARFNREGISVQVAPDVVGKVWDTAEKLGYGELFQDPVTGEIIDDHIFMNRAGVRTINIVDMRPSTKSMGFGGYEFGSFHHTHQDNLDQIDRNTLRAVGHTVAHVLYHVR